jgi:hypothetical protein
MEIERRYYKNSRHNIGENREKENRRRRRRDKAPLEVSKRKEQFNPLIVLTWEIIFVSGSTERSRILSVQSPRI